MDATQLTDIDQLVVDIGADSKRCFDDFLVDERAKHALGVADGSRPTQFLRELRAGPLGDVVASSALRILAARRRAVDDSAMKTQLSDWLDAHYHKQLSAYYTRPKARNAFEVLNALAPVVPALEEAVNDCIVSLKTLDGAEQLRRKLLQLLNSPAGRVVFRPYLPAEALGDQLGEVFQAAIDLRNAEDRDAVGTTHRRLSSHLEELEQLVNAHPTYYSRNVLLATIEALRAAAKRKLELKSPPARLTFEVSERPLPLRELGVTVAVVFSVTNEGDAPAETVIVTAKSQTDALVVSEERVELGRMEPRTRHAARFDLIVRDPVDEAMVEFEARWTNLDHGVDEARSLARLTAHQVDIDWPALDGVEPFANYPVERPEELVGRAGQLMKLRNAYAQPPLANYYITGQRRVGKTSLVRAFEKELRSTAPQLCIARVELGEARGAGGETTIGNLGRKLAERVLQSADLIGEIQIPDFNDSLAPLTDVVDKILEWDANLRFLFVIDEFDELPHQTYRRDGPGDALFVPMRSLAQKPNVGWLLVGGEKMPFIRDEQATRLNNFRELSLDYLDLHEKHQDGHSRDFAELVERPLPHGFVVEDAAVRAIFDASSGNPHFAKELCATLFTRCVARRDAMITLGEVQASISATARERDVELFAHFWEDGIFDIEDERRRTELARREYLIALAHLLRAGTVMTEDRVRQAAVARGLDAREVDRLGTEFVRRNILDDHSGTVGVHVPLFRLWLESEGIYKLPPKGLTEKIGEELSESLDAVRVSNGEMRRLARQWESFQYRGQRIARDQIESWLEQFDSETERRLAFRLLERLHVLTEAQIYEGLRRMHRHVAASGTIELRPGQRRLTHVLVSPLGDIGASGDSYAYKYRGANNIHQNNFVMNDRLIDRLLQRSETKVVVLVDDFIGTGGTAISALETLAKRSGELHARSEVQWYLFAVSGRFEAAQEVADSDPGRRLGLQVELAFPLLEADMPLGEKGTVFNAAERQQAERMLKKYGSRLSKWPLGFGRQCALVVFPGNCPNNCPPILWANKAEDGEHDGWTALFPRTPR